MTFDEAQNLLSNFEDRDSYILYAQYVFRNKDGSQVNRKDLEKDWKQATKMVNAVSKINQKSNNVKRFFCWFFGHKWRSVGYDITQWGGVDCYLKCHRCKAIKTVEE